MKPSPASAIAMKADDIRIVARRGIKLITLGANQINSQGGKLRSTLGVDIIAGNKSGSEDVDFEIQPMVKGNNLVSCLKALNEKLDSLASIVQGLALAQHKYNKVIANHRHNSPFWANLTRLSDPVSYAGDEVMKKYINDIQRSIENQKKNQTGIENNYLSRGGDNYINSRHNNVN